MEKSATFFSIFPVNKHPSNSEVICRCRSTYDGCDLVSLATSSVGDSELIIHFQEAYAKLFSNCYNKQVIQSNLPPYRPMNQGTICAKVYPECVQPVQPGRVAQSVGHLTRKSGVLGSIPGLATYFRFSFRFFKKGSCQLLAKV